jgi:glycosyltransferase involved in cell wall biosynthesis
MYMNISVIVPFYKAERYIAECIRALLSQKVSADSYEIIMVDNNSPDRSKKIIRQYPRVKLIWEQQQGAYAARNRGIGEAKGAIIAFTDPDCLPSPDWLEKIAIAMSCPEVGIVLGHRQLARDSLALSMLEVYEAVKASYVFGGITREIYFGYTNNMAVRRELFDTLGQFLEISRGADTVFVRWAVDSYGCQVVHYAPDVLVRHMEITSVGSFCRKKLIYGGSNQDCSEVVQFRPLTNVERLELFKSTFRRERCSVTQSVRLLLLLGFGAACYEFGRQRSIWGRRLRQRVKNF